jgi:hypothetical protein
LYRQYDLRMLRVYIYAWNALKENYISFIDEKWIDEMGTNHDSFIGNVLMQYFKNCINGTGFTTAFRIGDTEEQLSQIKRDILLFMFKANANYRNLDTLISFNSYEFFEILSIAFQDQGPSSPFSENLTRRNLVEILLRIMNGSLRNQLSHFFLFLLRFMDLNLIPFDKTLFFEIFKYFMNSKSEAPQNNLELQIFLQNLMEREMLISTTWITDLLIKTVQEQNMFRLALFLHKQRNQFSKVIYCYLRMDDNDVFDYLRQLAVDESKQMYTLEIHGAIIENIIRLVFENLNLIN